MSRPRFRERVAADLRHAILQIIEQAAGATNSRVLGAELPSIGHTVSADRLRTELAWLSEQDAVMLEEVGAMHVVTLTERGADLAAGRATIPGVRRPAPHELR